MSLGNSLVAKAPTIEDWQKDDPNYLLVGKNLTEAQINAIKTNGTPLVRTITAYNAVWWQTDDTPCVSASGINVCETDKKICASNEFPFGTRLLINGEIWEVQDRLNSRYTYRIDLLMSDYSEAKNWGKKTLEIVLMD